MRKSEHTQLAAVARIAVHSAEIGLSNLSYGAAAKAAHLSKGGVQRLFPTLSALQAAVLSKTGELMLRALFRDFHVLTNVEQCQDFQARWAAWILGERLARECAASVPVLIPMVGFAMPAPCAYLASYGVTLSPDLHAIQAQIYQQLQLLCAQRLGIGDEKFERAWDLACALRARSTQGDEQIHRALLRFLMPIKGL
jgi:hypothetical protein